MAVRFLPELRNAYVRQGQRSEIEAGGALIRLNRQTQALEPGLASSWKVSWKGLRITSHLRSGLHFSDGTPFTAEDVAPHHGVQLVSINAQTPWKTVMHELRRAKEKQPDSTFGFIF